MLQNHRAGAGSEAPAISGDDILTFLQATNGSHGHPQHQNHSHSHSHSHPHATAPPPPPPANSAADINKFEALLSIEKSDEHFHKHALIKHLRKLIDASVGHLLDDQIARLTSDSHDSSVPLIVDRIMTSSEYLNLVSAVSDQVRKSQQQHNLVLRPFNNTLYSHGGFNENYHHSFSTHSNATNDSSSGSLTSSSFMAPPVEEVKLIISNLQNKNSLDLRLGAAQKFNLLSIADLLSSEFWADTKSGIEMCLAEQDIRISGIGLRVCSKVFKSSPPPLTGELFLILVQHLINLFESGNVPKLGEGLNTAEPRVDLLFRKFRLLLQFQHELPSCWLRFPDQMFCNCLNAAYRLLRKPKRSPSSIGALHVISILDPTAGWFEKWTLSCVGRAQSVASIGKADLAVDLISSFLLYLNLIPLEGGEKFPTNASLNSSGLTDEVVVMDVEANDEAEKGDLDDSGNRNEGFISSWDLEYMHFCQVMVVLGKLVRGKAGRLCFPVVVDLGGIKWREKELWSLFVSELIRPVKKMIEAPTQTPGNLNERILINIAHLLSNMASSEMGRRLILRGDETNATTAVSSQKNTKSSKSPDTNKNVPTILITLITFVVDSLEGILHPSDTLSLQVLGAFVFFMRQLYRTCEGVQLLQQYTLHRALTRNMGDSKWFHKWNKVGNTEMSRKEWEVMTIDNLLNFAGTPKGVLLLHESGAMEQCVAHMFHRYQKKMQVSACEKFGYGVLVSQVSVTGPGMKALCKTGLIGSYIRSLWDLLEFENPLGEPEIEIDDYHSRKMVSSMLKALSSFSGLSAILDFESSQKSLDINTVTYVIRKLVLVDQPIPNDPLVMFDEGSQVGLRMLSLVTSSLDSCILLQSKFHFQEALLRQQEHVRLKDLSDEEDDTVDGYIIDENSMTRNKILASTYVMGGPKERVLPQIDSQLYETQKMQMFSQYPTPKCYTGEFNGVSIEAENKDVLMLRQLLLGENTSYDSLVHGIQKSVSTICKNMPMIPLRVMNEAMQKLIGSYSALSVDKASKLGWSLMADCLDELPEFPKHWDLSFSGAQDLGISMAVRYAKRLLPSSMTSTAKRDLSELLRRVQVLLDPTIIQHATKGSKSSTKPSTIQPYVGFD
ncbi:UNVERIFIED_CONTAM: hypothetical protein HDU68_009986, partial [Siphonaria sp. JEL0065]